MPVVLWIVLGFFFLAPPIAGALIVLFGVKKMGAQAPMALAFGKGMLYGALGGLAVCAIVIALAVALKTGLEAAGR